MCGCHWGEGGCEIDGRREVVSKIVMPSSCSRYETAGMVNTNEVNFLSMLGKFGTCPWNEALKSTPYLIIKDVEEFFSQARPQMARWMPGSATAGPWYLNQVFGLDKVVEPLWKLAYDNPEKVTMSTFFGFIPPVEEAPAFYKVPNPIYWASTSILNFLEKDVVEGGRPMTDAYTMMEAWYQHDLELRREGKAQQEWRFRVNFWAVDTDILGGQDLERLGPPMQEHEEAELERRRRFVAERVDSEKQRDMRRYVRTKPYRDNLYSLADLRVKHLPQLEALRRECRSSMAALGVPPAKVRHFFHWYSAIKFARLHMHCTFSETPDEQTPEDHLLDDIITVLTELRGKGYDGETPYRGYPGHPMNVSWFEAEESSSRYFFNQHRKSCEEVLGSAEACDKCMAPDGAARGPPQAADGAGEDDAQEKKEEAQGSLAKVQPAALVGKCHRSVKKLESKCQNGNCCVPHDKFVEFKEAFASPETWTREQLHKFIAFSDVGQKFQAMHSKSPELTEELANCCISASVGGAGCLRDEGLQKELRDQWSTSAEVKADLEYINRYHPAAIGAPPHIATRAAYRTERFLQKSSVFEAVLGGALLTWKPVVNIVRRFTLRLLDHVLQVQGRPLRVVTQASMEGPCFAGYTGGLFAPTRRGDPATGVPAEGFSQDVREPTKEEVQRWITESANTRELLTRFYGVFGWDEMRADKEWIKGGAEAALDSSSDKTLDPLGQIPRERMPKVGEGIDYVILAKVSDTTTKIWDWRKILTIFRDAKDRRSHLKKRSAVLTKEDIPLPRKSTAYPPLSAGEEAHISKTCMNYFTEANVEASDLQGRIPWISGGWFYRNANWSPVGVLSELSGWSGAAQSSGSTWAAMSMAEHLGFSLPELMLLRLALAGWMSPWRDHTMLEVFQGAARSFPGLSYPKWDTKWGPRKKLEQWDWDTMHKQLLPDDFLYVDRDVLGHNLGVVEKKDLDGHIRSHLADFNRRHGTEVDFDFEKNLDAVWERHEIFDHIHVSRLGLGKLQDKAGIRPQLKPCPANSSKA